VEKNENILEKLSCSVRIKTEDRCAQRAKTTDASGLKEKRPSKGGQA